MARNRRGIELALQIVGAAGKPSNRKLKAAAGAALREVLNAAGVDPKGKNLSVNGERAKGDTKLKDGDKIQVTERPEGS